MVYVLGAIGFIGGFVFGQMLLFFMLRNVSKEDLLNDPYIKWKYGLTNWACAILGAYSFVAMYGRFFG
jgi:ABC-type antimicrobial peptide transport system permease subunit